VVDVAAIDVQVFTEGLLAIERLVIGTLQPIVEVHGKMNILLGRCLDQPVIGILLVNKPTINPVVAFGSPHRASA
jgi:hypothetical protein